MVNNWRKMGVTKRQNAQIFGYATQRANLRLRYIQPPTF